VLPNKKVLANKIKAYLGQNGHLGMKNNEGQKRKDL
jgi:hypothetical protein